MKSKDVNDDVELKGKEEYMSLQLEWMPWQQCNIMQQIHTDKIIVNSTLFKKLVLKIPAITWWFSGHTAGIWHVTKGKSSYFAKYSFNPLM